MVFFSKNRKISQIYTKEKENLPNIVVEKTTIFFREK
jgi:hypothetical protein